MTCVQATVLDIRQQIDAAVAAERYSEADALQAEHDAASEDAAAIAAMHSFSSDDLGSELIAMEAAAHPAVAGAKQMSQSPRSFPDHTLGMRQSEPAASALPAAQPGLPDQATVAEPRTGAQSVGAPRPSFGARSASYVATDGSESVRSIASDGGNMSDVEAPQQQQQQQQEVVRLLANKATANGLLRPHQLAGVLPAINSSEALGQICLERQLSDAGSGYMADSDSVRPLRQGSQSSLDSLNLAAGMLRGASSAAPPADVAAAPADKPSLPIGMSTREGSAGSGGVSEGPTGAAQHPPTDASHSAVKPQPQDEEDLLSTAATVGGDSTRWGGSDAGAGDAMWGAQSERHFALPEEGTHVEGNGTHIMHNDAHDKDAHLQRSSPSPASHKEPERLDEGDDHDGRTAAGGSDLFAGLTFA